MSDIFDRRQKERQDLTRSEAIWTGIHIVAWPVGFTMLLLSILASFGNYLDFLSVLAFAGVVQAAAISMGAGAGLGAYWLFSNSSFSVRRMSIVMAFLVNIALFGWALVAVLG